MDNRQHSRGEYRAHLRVSQKGGERTRRAADSCRRRVERHTARDNCKACRPDRVSLRQDNPTRMFPWIARSDFRTGTHRSNDKISVLWMCCSEERRQEDRWCSGAPRRPRVCHLPHIGHRRNSRIQVGICYPGHTPTCRRSQGLGCRNYLPDIPGRWWCTVCGDHRRSSREGPKP